MTTEIYSREMVPYSYYATAPGYRDFYVIGKLPDGREVEIKLNAVESLRVATAILEMHDLAWRDRPLDAEPDERRPTWVVPFGLRLTWE